MYTNIVQAVETMEWMPLLLSFLLMYNVPVSSFLSQSFLLSPRKHYGSTRYEDQSTGTDDSSLSSLVKRTLYDSPFIDARSLVDDDIVYTSQVLYPNQLKGSSEYIELSQAWKKRSMPSLYRSKFCVMKIIALNGKCIMVDWNVTFVSENLEAIVTIFDAIPFVKVRFFDILNRERIRYVAPIKIILQQTHWSNYHLSYLK